MNINKEFFMQDVEKVAEDLLGCILIRKINGKELRGRIVETEAYFDEKDPASRARQNGDLRDTMMMEAGKVLVYGVHNNWLINFVTGNRREARAVLLRAIEPLNFNGKGNGPGLLTKSLKIDKKFHKKSVIDSDEIKVIGDEKQGFEVIRKPRIGVKNDLDKPMRFYIKGNKHVSKF